MTNFTQLPSPEEAHAVIAELHKRAFLGRLAELGEIPETEKEAHALLDLGIALIEQQPEDHVVKSANAYGYGNGPYAQVLMAFTDQSSNLAPGFGSEKSASYFDDAGGGGHLPELHPSLIDATWNTSMQLAQDPTIFGAAIVKRAEYEAGIAEMAAAAGNAAK